MEQEIIKALASVTDETFTIKVDGTKVTVKVEAHDKTFECDADEWTPHDWARMIALDLEPSIDFDTLEDRYPSVDMRYYEMGEPGYGEHLILGDWWENVPTGATKTRLRKRPITVDSKTVYEEYEEVVPETELRNIGDRFDFQVNIQRLCNNKNWKCEIDDFHLAFDDEWYYCSDCGKAYRTTHDSYSWRSQMVLVEEREEYVCQTCLKQDADDVMEYLSQLVNDPKTCTTLDLDMEEYGYVQFNGEFASGWHEHMNDDPHVILESLHERGFPHVIFKVPHVSQFYVNFESWVRKEDVKEWNGDKPNKGVGMTPMEERYVKVTDGDETTFQPMEMIFEELVTRLTTENGHEPSDMRYRLMTMDEGESKAVHIGDDMIHLIRITEECFDKHSKVLQ